MPKTLLCLRDRLGLNVGLCHLDLRKIGIGVRPGVEKLVVCLRRLGVLALFLPGIRDSVEGEAGVWTLFEILFIRIARVLIMSGANQRSSQYFQRWTRILRRL